MFRMNKQKGPTLQHRELYIKSPETDHDRKLYLKKKNVCIYIYIYTYTYIYMD